MNFVLINRILNVTALREPWRLTRSVGALLVGSAVITMFSQGMFGLTLIFLFCGMLSLKQGYKIRAFFDRYSHLAMETNNLTYDSFAVDVRNSSLYTWIGIFLYGWFWVTIIQSFNLPEWIILHVVLLASGFCAWSAEPLLRESYIKIFMDRNGASSSTREAGLAWRNSPYIFKGREYVAIFETALLVCVAVFLFRNSTDIAIYLNESVDMVSLIHASYLKGLITFSSIKESMIKEYSLASSFFEMTHLLGLAKDKILNSSMLALARLHY